MQKGYLALLMILSGCVAIAPNEDDAKPNRLPPVAARLLDRADRVEVLSVDPAMRDRPRMVKPDGTPVPPRRRTRARTSTASPSSARRP